MIEIPDITGKELFDFLVANKSKLISQKKFEMKRGDAVSSIGTLQNRRGAIVKAAAAAISNPNQLEASLIINTTYYRDSHGDVHIDGLWKKSLNETRLIYLLENHKMEFDKIISEDVSAHTKKIPWRELGVDFDGKTEALVFDAMMKRDDNPDMFDRYKNGKVKQHSVGMRYVSLDLAINDEDYPARKALWDKYIDKIANRDETEAAGYFWPVTEAKVIEGSAVPLGSNPITPVHHIKNIAPPAGTQKRAANSGTLSALNNLLTLTKNVR